MACKSRTLTWTGYSWWWRVTLACSSPRTCRARVKRRRSSPRSVAPSCSPRPSVSGSTSQIIEVASWQPYERVADQFQCGRVFLVGDAAHTMPPFKAGGANTAIQSADNLAWKLAAVLNGQAEPALLSTYQAERHPVGRFNARQSLTGPSLALLRLDDDRPQLPPAEEAPMFALLIGYQYRSAAVISDEPSPTDPDAVSLVEELRGQPAPGFHTCGCGMTASVFDARPPRFRVHRAYRRRAMACGRDFGVSRPGRPDHHALHRLTTRGRLLPGFRGRSAARPPG